MNYTYDALHRLKTAVTTGSALYPQWGQSWTGVYPERAHPQWTNRRNRYGNRQAQSVTAGSGPSNSVTVSTATNRITGMGAANFSYDANGNLTQDDLYKYKYDAENRMVELRNLTDVLIATYAFDGNSLRVVKVVGADRTWYIYAGSQLVSEYEDAASNTYAPGTTPGGAPADTASTILYQHSDHLTTRLTTENSGDLSNEQAHYPYGESWYESGTANPSVLRKYTSYMKDEEAGVGKLNYAVFREHGARIGRFHMPDPEHGQFNPQGLNRYSYVGGDPLNRVDPVGLWCIQLWRGWLCFDSNFPDSGGRGGGGPGACEFSRLGCVGGGGGASCNSFLTPPFFPGSTHPLCRRDRGRGADECVAELKYRHVRHWLAFLATHAFWCVTDRSGTTYNVSAGPSNSDGSVFLNVWVTSGCDAGSIHARYTGGIGICEGVDRLLAAARTWPNNTIAYSWSGPEPNSNSAARHLGNVGTFYPSGPPGAVGWRRPVPIGP